MKLLIALLWLCLLGYLYWYFARQLTWPWFVGAYTVGQIVNVILSGERRQ